MAKIGLVSFEDEDLVVANRQRWKFFDEIRDYAKENQVTHIFFSGSTLYDGRARNAKAVRSCICRIGNIFRDFCVIFEVNKKGDKESPYGLYAYEKGKRIAGPIIQLLWASYAESALYESLWDELAIGFRTVSLGGKKIMVLICGELNILHNQQSNDNKVDDLRKPLQGKKIRDLDYDILFNPTHTPLKGLYGKYKRRLEYISRRKEGRMAMLNFNVSSEQKKRTAAFIAYKEGREIKRSSEQQEDWSRGWAMRIISV